MYRVYLRTPDRKASEKTNTDIRSNAVAAFAALVNRVDLKGKKLAAVLSLDGKQIAFHKFDCQPGQAACWVGRTDQLFINNGLKMKKPILTSAALVSLKNHCSDLTRERYCKDLIVSGVGASQAHDMTAKNKNIFTFLFFVEDEKICDFFEITDDESGIRTTEADLERIMRKICVIYMRAIVDHACSIH